MKNTFTTILKMCLSAIWLFYIFSGISSNYMNYGLGEFLVITIYALIPFLIYFLIKNHREKNMKKRHSQSKILENTNITPVNYTQNTFSIPSPSAPTPPVQSADLCSYIDFSDIKKEIFDLLWIADGPYKNFDPDSTRNTFTYNGMQITISAPGSNEPSLIYTSLPISEPFSPEQVPLPPYYPSYENLSEEQRWMYLRFLSNPFDSTNNIGYVFIFYYGLERYLLTEKAQQAFDMILRLRSCYKNHSFLSYSETALIAYCIGKSDLHCAQLLFHSFKENNITVSAATYLALKYSLGIPVNADDIFNYRKQFLFNNNRYIKICPDVFMQYLQENIQNKYNSTTIDLSQYYSSEVFKSLPATPIPIVANTSIKNRIIRIPDMLSYEPFITDMLSLLTNAHENTKAYLAKERKK